MHSLPLRSLSDEIKNAFLAQDTLLLNKSLPEFNLNDKYFADYLNMLIVEPQGEKPPIFYHTFSPFDIISKQAPQHAVVFQNGKLLINTSFTDYAGLRTGMMDAVFLDTIHAKPQEKEIVFIGTGNIATHSLAGIAALFPEVKHVDFINPSGSAEKFLAKADENSINVSQSKLKDIGKYDFIFCHAKTLEPALLAEYKREIKKGAVISSYAGENYRDLASDFYSDNVNIVINWTEKLPDSNEIQVAIEKNQLDTNKFITLKDLLLNTVSLKEEAPYTIYRSDGTPMQNLAVLKLLMKQ